MAIKLHKAGYEHAKELIEGGLEVDHESGNWQGHKPTDDEIDKFIENHYLPEYGLWFLGIDTDYIKNDKNKYMYPHGNLGIVHISALKLAASEAARKGHKDIEKAALELIELISKQKRS